MAIEPTTAEPSTVKQENSEAVPVVIANPSGEVLPTGSDFRSSQIKRVAQETVDRLDDATKLEIQRQALENGFNQFQQVGKNQAEKDLQFMANLSKQPVSAEVPKKHWYSFLKFW